MPTDSSTEPEVAVTVPECGARIRTPSSTLYRMIAQNEISCLRTGVKGRGLRVFPSEVIAALRARAAWIKP